MDLSLVRNINILPYRGIIPENNITNVSFLSRKNVSDSFQRSNDLNTIALENPYNNDTNILDLKDIDIYQMQEITCKSTKGKDDLTLYYDPDNTDIIFDKRKNKNLEIVVLESENENNPKEHCFHFFSKDLKTNYGYGLISEYDNNITEVYTKPASNNVEGITKLTNKYAVQCAKATFGQKPQIIAYPRPENYLENFVSGNRFEIPEKNTVQYKFFMDKYNNPNPNKVIINEKHTSNWPVLKMYLPENTVNEYYNNYIEDGLHILNPILDKMVDIDECIDISVPHEYSIERPDHSVCRINFDPHKKGQLVDKNTGKPIDVFIIELNDDEDEDITSLHFISTDLKKEYGHVEIDINPCTYGHEFEENYRKEGIIGDRVVISWLVNDDKENTGGVGKLADKVEVKYCVENGIAPNIISSAGEDSHIAHFSRGKRFIIPKNGSDEYEFLMRTYGTSNPNNALNQLLKESKKTGEKVDLSKWNKYCFMMYLPKNLVNKYKNEEYTS